MINHCFNTLFVIVASGEDEASLMTLIGICSCEVLLKDIEDWDKNFFWDL